MSKIIESHDALPTVDALGEASEVSLATTTGSGSVTYSYDNSYGSAPVVVATAEGIDDVPVEVSAKGASQCTLSVTGSAVADASYTVNVVVFGN